MIDGFSIALIGGILILSLGWFAKHIFPTATSLIITSVFFFLCLLGYYISENTATRDVFSAFGYITGFVFFPMIILMLYNWMNEIWKRYSLVSKGY